LIIGKTTLGSMVRQNEKIYYNATCQCGAKWLIQSTRVASCKGAGCWECSRKAGVIHGLSRTKLKGVLYGMRRRCYNPKSEEYHNYGARGITICQEWSDLPTFYKWAMDNGYKEGLSIERIDNDKGYSPSNCKLATQQEQKENMRTNRNFEIDGTTKCLGVWCKEFGIATSTVQKRLKKGMSVKEAFTTPPNPLFQRYSKQ